MEKIVLRPWQEDDAPALFKLFSQNLDLQSQAAPMETLADAAGQIAKWREDSVQDQSFALALIASGELAGGVMISEIDRRHDSAWLSYWIAPGARGLGLASRCAATVAEYAFTQLHIFRLVLGHRVNNPASGRVAINAGFTLEGRQRAKLRYGVERFDTQEYARLATDLAPELAPIVIDLSV